MNTTGQNIVIPKMLKKHCTMQCIQDNAKLFLRYKETGFILCFFFFTTSAQAQFSISKDSASYIFSHSPAFSIYKDNYFITGTSVGDKPTKDNSDVKFQFSFKYRLSDDPMLWGSYVYLIYTQKSFWNIYQQSSPFEETNYNPGILIAKPLYKNDRLKGSVRFSIEHESNGRDSISSRSWNFASIGYSHIFSKKLNASLNIRLPFGLGDNPDLMDYIGYSEAQVSWIIKEQKLFLDVTGRKAFAWNNKGSLATNLSFRPTMKRNLYVTLQWWQGYSESLIDYTESRNMVRVGILIKPSLLKFY